MGLTINEEEHFSTGIVRILQEQCDVSLKELQAKPINHQTIHEVRKSFKKIRAAHRLLRDYCSFYKQENTFFRDEAKKLSHLRDASAMLEIVGTLTERYSDSLYKNTFGKVKEALIERREAIWNLEFDKQEGFKPLLERLQEKCSEYDQLSVEINDFDNIKPSIHRVYYRGFEAHKNARKNKTKEVFHEWRKRAKYLRYQVKMLKEIWEPLYKTWEDELHDLTDLLGDDQDLYHLKSWLNEASPNFNSEEKSLLLALIEQNQKEYKENALRLGEKLYALHPNAFVDQMEACWKVTRVLQK